jgi:hypothetical protein
MELQQQQVGGLAGSFPPLAASDVTAKGAIDLQPMSVTSPLSSTDSEHEDTGYNSAVSSTGVCVVCVCVCVCVRARVHFGQNSYLGAVVQP